MQTLAELSDRLITQQMKVKEDMIQSLYKEQDVLSKDDLASLTYIQYLRNWDPVAFCAIQPDRDDMLNMVLSGAYSFSADQVGVVFEGWASRSEKNPVTGDDWERDDMAHLALNEDGLEKGLIGESLIVHAIDREGNISMRIRHFKIEDKEVVWLRDLDMDADTSESAEGSGVVVDAMRYCMKQPTLLGTVSGEHPLTEDETEEELKQRREAYRQVGRFLDEDTRMYHMDVAGMKHMADDDTRPEMMMLGLSADPGSRRAELIDQNMEAAFPGQKVQTSGSPI